MSNEISPSIFAHTNIRAGQKSRRSHRGGNRDYGGSAAQAASRARELSRVVQDNANKLDQLEDIASPVFEYAGYGVWTGVAAVTAGTTALAGIGMVVTVTAAAVAIAILALRAANQIKRLEAQKKALEAERARVAAEQARVAAAAETARKRMEQRRRDIEARNRRGYEGGRGAMDAYEHGHYDPPSRDVSGYC